MNNQQVDETEMEYNCVHSSLSQSVVSAALRAVGNIVTGDDIQTQVAFWLLFFFGSSSCFGSFLFLFMFCLKVIINCGALPCLLQLLSAPKESIRKEVNLSEKK